MRTLAIVCLAVLLLGIPAALATGNFSCSFGDRNLRFESEATFSHGIGEGFVSFGARVDVLVKGVPDDLRQLDFGLDQLTQRWLWGKQLKLRLYRERPGAAPHGYIELIVETKQVGREETDYRGTYMLTVHDLPAGEAEGKTLTLRGRAMCSVG